MTTTEQWTRDHDARLAELLGFQRDEDGWWVHTGWSWAGLPRFGTDLNATARAQAEVERRGLPVFVAQRPRQSRVVVACPLFSHLATSRQ